LQLEHSFTVPTGVDEAWRILLDVERIGPCLPGASIDSVDGDDFTGTVKVKLGPINLTYKGKASFVEKDEVAHRAVIDARGRDARGNGTAAAKVVATLAEKKGTTTVVVTTDLDITGKPAQFGRGVMEDVGRKLIGQFADCLASTITSGEREVGSMAAADKGEAADAAAEEPKAPPRKRAPRPKKAVAAEASPEVAAAAETAPPPTDAVADVPSAADDGPEVVEDDEAAARDHDADLAEDESGDALLAEPSPVAVNGYAGARRPDDVEPIDLLANAGPAVAKRMAGPAAVGLLFVLIAWRRRAKRRAG
jgi:carbon monoxide dehydrogenase subunit G